MKNNKISSIIVIVLSFILNLKICIIYNLIDNDWEEYDIRISRYILSYIKDNIKDDNSSTIIIYLLIKIISYFPDNYDTNQWLFNLLYFLKDYKFNTQIICKECIENIIDKINNDNKDTIKNNINYIYYFMGNYLYLYPDFPTPPTNVTLLLFFVNTFF